MMKIGLIYFVIMYFVAKWGAKSGIREYYTEKEQLNNDSQKTYS